MLTAAGAASTTRAATAQENGGPDKCKCGGGDRNGNLVDSNGHAKGAKEAGGDEENGTVQADRHANDRCDEALQPCNGIDDY